jgi:hypothetical protein
MQKDRFRAGELRMEGSKVSSLLIFAQGFLRFFRNCSVGAHSSGGQSIPLITGRS